ncbi:MAG: ABC transporter ATP-binding protein/permease [Oscillospiraceae bacterium]|jgi:ABC-type transport system involved in cytochrome bd biosynthesis fused ATPase/permease subunit|nr:ABC transporter ATP-binding protein/permease [Oscillospiraceae bacterium]
MFVNKRLIGMAKGARRYIAFNVLSQWLSLLATAGIVFSVTDFLRDFREDALPGFAAALAVCAVIRFCCARLTVRMSHFASEHIKTGLRERIYRKALALGASYSGSVRTSEITQAAGEGVDQIEVYFGKYLPQLFYGAIAPVTLFFLLYNICLPAASVLLICAPLILLVTAAVARTAKKVFSKYWGVYTDLGASFLENLQGLTTLKIYGADGAAAKKMDEDAEAFRGATMRVLGVQLSSLSAMDLVAFGGAAAGIIVAVLRYAAGALDLWGCLAVALLAAEFFIPVRLIGSYFHAAMNGVAASEKIFAILDLPETADTGRGFDAAGESVGVSVSGLGFSYGRDRAPALRNVDLRLVKEGMTALVGESGCGKSTLAKIISGTITGYTGSVRLEIRARDREVDQSLSAAHSNMPSDVCADADDTVATGGAGDANAPAGANVRSSDAAGKSVSVELNDIARADLMRSVTLVGSNSHIFTGSVRDNLMMAKPDATDAEMWMALGSARLTDFLTDGAGLDTLVSEDASNLSGGQRQRLAIARALMRNSSVYVFDEATSNIDAESEGLIMETVSELARTKTVLIISHRLANVTEARAISVMEGGRIAETGTHGELLYRDGIYARMYGSQMDLESAAFAEEGAGMEVANG